MVCESSRSRGAKSKLVAMPHRCILYLLHFRSFEIVSMANPEISGDLGGLGETWMISKDVNEEANTPTEMASIRGQTNGLDTLFDVDLTMIKLVTTLIRD